MKIIFPHMEGISVAYVKELELVLVKNMQTLKGIHPMSYQILKIKLRYPLTQ